MKCYHPIEPAISTLRGTSREQKQQSQAHRLPFFLHFGVNTTDNLDAQFMQNNMKLSTFDRTDK